MLAIQQLTPAQIGRAYAKLRCEPSYMEWVDVAERRCTPFIAILIALRKMPARQVAESFHGRSFESCCKDIAMQLRTHIGYVAGVETGFARITLKEVSEMDIPAYLLEYPEFDLGYSDGLKLALAFD